MKKMRRPRPPTSTLATAAFFHFLLNSLSSPPTSRRPPRSILTPPSSLCHPSILSLSPLRPAPLARQRPSVTALVVQARSHVSGLVGGRRSWADPERRNVIVKKAALGIEVSRQVQHGLEKKTKKHTHSHSIKSRDWMPQAFWIEVFWMESQR